MGMYVNPPSLVLAKGRKVAAKRTFEDTRLQLAAGEMLCVYKKNTEGNGYEGFVIVSTDDFDEMIHGQGRRLFVQLYAVGPTVLACAH